MRVIGASNFQACHPAVLPSRSAARKICRATKALQPEYNLYVSDKFEGELETVCRENHIGVIPYFSLASGFLTGKYRSEKDLENRSRGSRVQKYLNPRGLRILAALDEVSKQQNATPAQISLAWLLAKPTIAAPIASATSVKQLDELLGAARVKLDPAAVQKLDQASAYSEEERNVA